MSHFTPGQEIALAVVKVAVFIGALQGLFSFMTYLERRLLAFMQFRLGPNRTGPFGLLQPVADGIKLFFKEEFIPEGANRFIFVAAPAVAITTAFLAIAVVPYGGPITLPGFLVTALGWIVGLIAKVVGFVVSVGPWFNVEWLRDQPISLQIADLDVGVLYIFAITSLGVYGIVMAGWASNNKYTLIGGLRSSAQMFSYELSLGLSWVTIIMLAGSFKITEIVLSQDRVLGGHHAGLLGWNWLVQFPAFIVYMIAATAEVNRTPFDLPEAETELVAGFHTEYSSMRFALLQMAEYINMITVAALGANLFLGGWLAPLPFLPEGGLFGLLWFVMKMGVILFVFIWLRGTVPRLRYDQLMHFGWKVLVPVATVWILITATAIVVAAPGGVR
jgi:NADH-quinone oxidoreductase subunit H